MTSVYHYAKQQLAIIAMLGRNSPLARVGLMLSVASVLTGLLGYFYQIIMGRMLAPSEFALFSAIMALIMFVASPLNAIFMIVSRQISVLRAAADHAAKRALYWRLHIYIFAIALPLVAGLLIGGETLQTWLKSPSASLIWILAASLFFMALFVINNAFLQGHQLFGMLAGAGLLFALLKILFSILGIELGYGLEGALTGLMFAYALVWLIGMLFCLRGNSKVRTKEIPVQDGFKWQRAWPVLLANVGFAAMTQLDMVLVNWYFLPEEAGQYAAASILGKAVLYLPGGLVLAIYPMVAENHANQLSSANLLKQAVALTVLLCGAAALTYWLIGEKLISLFYGANYTEAGELLRWYGFAILPMALVLVAEYFLIAKDRVLFVWLFMIMAPLQLLAIYFWHDSLATVIGIIGISGGFLAAIGYSILFLEYRVARES
jgi:O-antigen/teichoic acid export membrane protein